MRQKNGWVSALIALGIAMFAVTVPVGRPAQAAPAPHATMKPAVVPPMNSSASSKKMAKSKSMKSKSMAKPKATPKH